MDFEGFSDETFAFLGELEEHNQRDWFEANKARYERVVREPALAFVRDMGRRLPEVAPALRADDRKVGGSMMRVHRDTRFAKDKSPYKTNVGIQFRHEAGKDVHAVGLYVHLDTHECFACIGIYGPEPAVLNRIRDGIVAGPDRWAKVTKGLDRRTSDALVRPPRGYPADHRFADDLKLKSHMAIWRPTHDQIASADLSAWLAARVVEAGPFAAFLCEATGVVW